MILLVLLKKGIHKRANFIVLPFHTGSRSSALSVKKNSSQMKWTLHAIRTRELVSSDSAVWKASTRRRGIRRRICHMTTEEFSSLRISCECDAKSLRSARKTAMAPRYNQTYNSHDTCLMINEYRWEDPALMRNAAWYRIHQVMFDWKTLSRYSVRYPFQNGWYVTVHVKNVPRSVARSRAPLVLFGLFPHEQKMSVLNVAIKRHQTFNLPIQTKERLIFHVGFRR